MLFLFDDITLLLYLVTLPVFYQSRTHTSLVWHNLMPQKQDKGTK